MFTRFKDLLLFQTTYFSHCIMQYLLHLSLPHFRITLSHSSVFSQNIIKNLKQEYFMLSDFRCSVVCCYNSNLCMQAFMIACIHTYIHTCLFVVYLLNTE
jgi:hypothetical protein